MRFEDKVHFECVFELGATELRLRNVHVHVPNGPTGVLSGGANWQLLTQLFLAYHIRVFGQTSCSPVYLDKADSPLGEDFDRAWALVKNHLNKKPEKGKPTSLQDHIKGIKQHARDEEPFAISIDPMQLPWGNITFSFVTDPHRASTRLTRCDDLHVVMDALAGRNVAAVRGLGGTSDEQPAQTEPFQWGDRATKTYVAQYFPDGLALEYVECHKSNDDFELPPELMPLVWEANQLISTSNNAGHVISNVPMFAPMKIEVVDDFGEDSNFRKVMIWLGQSHYNFYIVAAFADTLASRDAKFQPLQRFVNQITDYRVPSPASCSLGTRIMLETADERLVVAYRSRDCKMNADVWSTSANEGVRPSILKGGASFSSLLDTAAREALKNELRVESGSVEYLALLSLHHNAFAQWGATLYAKTSLPISEVLRRQKTAHHRFEHSNVASVSVHLERCGKEMADLGTRWYGGALEAICSTLAFRELARRNHVMPEDVGRILFDCGGRRIEPIDEVNERFFQKTA